MKKERAQEILKKLQDQGLLRDEKTIEKLSESIEIRLEEEIDELNKERDELIDRIDFSSIKTFAL